MVHRTRTFSKQYRVLALEDFILTKLARDDRGNRDINDVIQLLILNVEEIDWKYLNWRLEWAKVKKDFIEIIDRVEKIRHLRMFITRDDDGV
ncbi:MAG: hypothetical protein ACTSU5_08870 [Promethearchaeota archaeon]